MSKFMTYDAWYEQYQPITNHFTKYGQLGFETYGDEDDYVRQQDNKHIWTEVDGDEGTYIISGYHWVNRIQYYITNKSWDDEYTEVPTWMERQCDCQEDLDTDIDSGVYCNECEEREGYIEIPCETVEDLKAIYGEKAEIVG